MQGPRTVAGDVPTSAPWGPSPEGGPIIRRSASAGAHEHAGAPHAKAPRAGEQGHSGGFMGPPVASTFSGALLAQRLQSGLPFAADRLRGDLATPSMAAQVPHLRPAKRGHDPQDFTGFGAAPDAADDKSGMGYRSRRASCESEGPCSAPSLLDEDPHGASDGGLGNKAHKVARFDSTADLRATRPFLPDQGHGFVADLTASMEDHMLLDSSFAKPDEIVSKFLDDQALSSILEPPTPLALPPPFLSSRGAPEVPEWFGDETSLDSVVSDLILGMGDDLEDFDLDQVLKA